MMSVYDALVAWRAKEISTEEALRLTGFTSERGLES